MVRETHRRDAGRPVRGPFAAPAGRPAPVRGFPSREASLRPPGNYELIPELAARIGSREECLSSTAQAQREIGTQRLQHGGLLFRRPPGGLCDSTRSSGLFSFPQRTGTRPPGRNSDTPKEVAESQRSRPEKSRKPIKPRRAGGSGTSPFVEPKVQASVRPRPLAVASNSPQPMAPAAVHADAARRGGPTRREARGEGPYLNTVARTKGSFGSVRRTHPLIIHKSAFHR